MRVLFVCSGNTCRSPMAEALLQRAISDAGWDDVTVGSAGTGAVEGAPASEGAYLVALEAGVDLSRHRARPLSTHLVRDADLVLAMSSSHLLRAEALGGRGHTLLLTEYAGSSQGSADVPDPYGGTVDAYRATFGQLEALVDGVRSRLAHGRAE